MSNHAEIASMGYPDHIFSFYSGTLTGVIAGGFVKIENALVEPSRMDVSAMSSLMDSVNLVGQVSGYLLF